MYLINKDQYFHVGIESTSTALTLPAGLYKAEYQRMTSASVFTPVGGTLGDYYDLGHEVQADVADEIGYFFSQDIQRGVLVHGAPGNGKTRMLCELIQQACVKYNAVALMGPSLDFMEIFVNAIRVDDPGRPIIVFWDEFDEIVDNDEHEVLRFLDGASSKAKTMTVAALNDLESLEERIYKRPGRFGLVAELAQPDVTIRTRFLSNLMTSPSLINQVAEATQGLSLDYVREIAHRMTSRGQTLDEAFRKLGLDRDEHQMPAEERVA